MLDFINYPVSAILWFWHRVFGTLIDPASGVAWALSVIFLVISLRALLFRPFVHQIRSMKKMQEFAPQIKELQAKHGDDRQKLSQEMQKLQLEQGFNPVSGCLPMLVQIPVFLGLFQVLNGFRPGAQGNFVFNAADVSSFVRADLFGAKLSNTISQSPEQLAAFETNRTAMLMVGVPLMIAAAIATHFTARHSVERQTADAVANPNAATMNQLTMWGFPMFAIIGGPFLPLAILIYWLTNNFWTLGQQRVVYRKIDRAEALAAANPPAKPTAADTVEVADPVQASGSPQTGSPQTGSDDAETASKDEPREVPGVIEDRSRDTDKPDEAR